MANIEDAPVRTLANAMSAHIVLYDPTAGVDDAPFVRVPATELDGIGGGSIPEDVLTRSEVSSMAFEDAAGFISVSTHASAIATKDAQIADLSSRITLLGAMIGVSGVVVLEADILEPGIVN